MAPAGAGPVPLTPEGDGPAPVAAAGDGPERLIVAGDDAAALIVAGAGAGSARACAPAARLFAADSLGAGEAASGGGEPTGTGGADAERPKRPPIQDNSRPRKCGRAAACCRAISAECCWKSARAWR